MAYFGRVASGKDTMRKFLKQQAMSIIEHGTTHTTLPRAKASRSFIEKMITCAKAEKPLYEKLRNLKSKFGIKEQSAKKLISDIAPQYKDRNGGYLRIIKNGFDLSAAPKAIVALV